MPNSHTSLGGGFFRNATHFSINGGQFMNNFNGMTAVKDGFHILQEHVATAAFHDSKQRTDPPRCHEHTREAILQELLDWIVGTISMDKFIAWLNGAAGSGKSAICQSLAEICIMRGIKVASFFFFRTDDTRNKIDFLIPTLAYQIIQIFPETRYDIIKAVESNPLIFDKAFQTQLEILIIQPLRRFRLSNRNWQLLFIIDGVDECSRHKSQTNLIYAISKALYNKDLPLIVLFGSRCENQLQMAFNSRKTEEILARFPLDDHYKPYEDIWRFLNDSFDRIKHAHPFRRLLAHGWPSPNHIQEIAHKSSGQFIYASIVIEFISAPSSNPSVQLDIVQGLRPSGRLTPFAQLDVLYQHIFSQVDDLPTVLHLLAYIIFSAQGPLNFPDVLFFFGLTAGDVQIKLAPLTSILTCNLDPAWISFRHASLPDFLRDENRSGEYCISALPTQLSISLLRQIATGKYSRVGYDAQNMDLPRLLKHAKPTADLYASLSTYKPSKQRSEFVIPEYACDLLSQIKRINFGDDGKLYDSMLRRMADSFQDEFPNVWYFIRRDHDVSHILQVTR